MYIYIYIQCLLSSNCILSYVNICYLPILRIFKTSPTVRDSGEGITTHQDVQKVQGHGALFTWKFRCPKIRKFSEIWWPELGKT